MLCFAFPYELYLIALIHWRNSSANIITCVRKKMGSGKVHTLVTMSLPLLPYAVHGLLQTHGSFGSFRCSIQTSHLWSSKR